MPSTVTATVVLTKIPIPKFLVPMNKSFSWSFCNSKHTCTSMLSCKIRGKFKVMKPILKDHFLQRPPVLYDQLSLTVRLDSLKDLDHPPCNDYNIFAVKFRGLPTGFFFIMIIDRFFNMWRLCFYFLL